MTAETKDNSRSSLVLTRCDREQLHLQTADGQIITITVESRQRTKLRIQSPTSVKILRGEVLERLGGWPQRVA